MTKANYKTLLDDAYFKRWLVLSSSPVNWVDASWQKTFEHGLPPSVLSHSNANVWLRENLSLTTIRWEWFHSPISKVLLLNSVALYRLLTVMGALCYTKEFYRVVTTVARQQLYDQLPAEQVHFIEQNGAMLLHDNVELLCAVSEALPLLQSDGETLVDFRIPGALILYRLLALSQQTLSTDPTLLASWFRYLQLQLPQSFASTTEDLTRHLPAADARVRLAITKLIRFLEPSCLHLLK
ncbi:MAG: SctK family type III secretion system sorting platform protein [Alteromonadaceae bacterium]|nr:SctK family type III secretion system sorting platform protein [Alteromonadaceae bacterium]